MSTSSTRRRNVTVIGGGMIGLATAINIQENVPDVHVEVLDDFGCSSMTTLMGSSKAIKPGFRASSSSANSGSTSAEILSNIRYTSDGEVHSLAAGIVKDSLDVGAASHLTQEFSLTKSSRTLSPDDVIWLPQSIPGLDDDMMGRGGHLRFWAVLTWYHLYELVQKESSCKTGVRLLSDYIFYHRKYEEVSDWWKDLVPEYRSVHIKSVHDQSASCSGYSTSFTTATINAPLYLQYLSERLLSCRGRLKEGHISSINELSGPCSLLVNCSGENISELSNTAEFQTIQAHKLQLTPSMHTSKCWQRCQFEGIRLEAETITHRGRPLSVVHNYGYTQDHLATLHWGCAQEAARLASDILAGRFIGPTSKL